MNCPAGSDGDRFLEDIFTATGIVCSLECVAQYNDGL
jgi:hypothetical protein